jgi:hypothetical protein
MRHLPNQTTALSNVIIGKFYHTNKNNAFQIKARYCHLLRDTVYMFESMEINWYLLLLHFISNCRVIPLWATPGFDGEFEKTAIVA